MRAASPWPLSSRVPVLPEIGGELSRTGKDEMGRDVVRDGKTLDRILYGTGKGGLPSNACCYAMASFFARFFLPGMLNGKGKDGMGWDGMGCDSIRHGQGWDCTLLHTRRDVMERNDILYGTRPIGWDGTGWYNTHGTEKYGTGCHLGQEIMGRDTIIWDRKGRDGIQHRTGENGIGWDVI